MANESLIFDILARDGASPSLKKVGDAALEASGSMKELSDKLKDVNGRVAAARVKLDGDKEAQHELDVTDAKLITLGKRVATGKVGLDGVARVRADISGIDLALDRLNAKSATATVGVSGGGRGGILGRLFGGGGNSSSGSGGATGGSGGGLSSLVSGGLTSPAGITAGVLGAAILGPGVIGAGLGGAVGLGAIGGGLFGASEGTKILKADTATITQITTGLKTAIGNQKKILSADLVAANKQFAKDSNFFAPFLGFQKSLKDLAQTVLAPLRPIMEPLTKIITEFGKGLTGLAPQLTGLFKASLPFIQQFASVMLQSGKILIPAFTQALTEMVKSGALKLMTQGLVILVQGLAQFIVALGPGMKSSAMIFKDVATIISVSLHGIGLAASWLANVVEDFAHRWRVQFDKLTAQLAGWRHETAVIFDGVRHDIASIWDTIWNNTIGRLQRGIADDQRLMNQLRHNIASTFDTIRHDIASAWDTIWSNTVGRVRSGISDVIGWFRSLPGRAVSALTGLGHSLASFARSAIGEMWTGFKNTFSTVIHWFEGLPKMILHALGIHSPPSWAIDAGKHIMAGLHIGLGHGLGQLTSFTTAIGAQVAAGLSGALGGGMGDSGARTHSAAVAQAYASSLLSQYGWSQSQMSSLVPLWNQESGWSAYAVNQSSGAYGIPQSLGHGHPYALGDYKNQIIWGLNYIRQRYGSPAAAEAHERAFNWYGGGLDAIFSQPTVIGVGERGPEHVQVTPGGRGGGGNTYNIHITLPPGSDREQGRRIVGYVKAYEKGSGKGWRS